MNPTEPVLCNKANSYGSADGFDVLEIQGIDYAEMGYAAVDGGASLLISSAADLADGVVTSGIIIENYFTNPSLGLVDAVVFDDGLGFYL